MYTRCNHCAAVFRVTMKELTTAQGKLRCGECAGVFNAMDSLSTKLPDHTDPAESVPFDSLNKKQQNSFTTSGDSLIKNTPRQKENYLGSRQATSKKELWPPLLALALAAVLVAQVWLSRDFWFSQPRQPEKIKIVSKKVFSHPSQTDALIITASIKNLAKESQPYPYLEAKLLDIKNQTIALRRFRPHEYLKQYQPDVLLEGHTEVSIRLKIKDPGNKAKHFQFSFL